MRTAFYLSLLLTISLFSFAQGETTQMQDSPKDAPSPTPAPQDSFKVVVVKQVTATYPIAALQQGIQGRVMVKFLITETGEVESVEAVSGNPILVEAALKAAKKWRFAPSFKGGKPVKVNITLPFDFAFEGKVRDFSSNPQPLSTSSPSSDASDQKKTSDPNAPPPPTRVVRVSQGVSQGLLVRQVVPVYPPEARSRGIEGKVVLAAVIGKDGRVKNLNVVSGPKELTEAAIGAVQLWRYKPYMLMGEPVEVETQVLVFFTLR